MVRFCLLASPIGPSRTRLGRVSALHQIAACALALLALPMASARAEDGPTFVKPVVQEIEGWQVWVDPALLEGPHAEAGAESLRMLSGHLQRIAILVPEPALSRLRQVVIRIEHDNPTLNGMQYHPSEGWLRNNGHDPTLARQVHIPEARQLLSREQLLKHPAVVLHELAHAYHDQFLGFDQPEVIAAYEAARDAGTYESVLLYNGREVRHYGLTDHKEYFAEATEAFFYRNDFFPFVRAELRRHDPEMESLLEKLWESKGE